MTGKSSDVFFFFICFVNHQFILQRESISKKISFNYNFPIFHGGGRSNIFRGVQLFPGGKGSIVYSFIDI